MTKLIAIIVPAIVVAGCASNRSNCHCPDYVSRRPSVTVHSDGGPCKVIFVQKGSGKKVVRKVSEYEEF